MLLSKLAKNNNNKHQARPSLVLLMTCRWCHCGLRDGLNLSPGPDVWSVLVTFQSRRRDAEQLLISSWSIALFWWFVNKLPDWQERRFVARGSGVARAPQSGRPPHCVKSPRLILNMNYNQNVNCIAPSKSQSLQALLCKIITGLKHAKSENARICRKPVSWAKLSASQKPTKREKAGELFIVEHFL